MENVYIKFEGPQGSGKTVTKMAVKRIMEAIGIAVVKEEENELTVNVSSFVAKALDKNPKESSHSSPDSKLTA